jgi:hypothetical protein
VKLGLIRSLVVFALCAFAAVAQAQSDAKTLFLEGEQAYQQGDYENAIAKWKAAYALDARPLILYNLGGAYERLGKSADALEAFEKYLATAPDDDRTRRAEVSAKAERIRARLKDTGVVVSGAPDGATIFIDDTSWGLTPRPDAIHVDPGSHTVRLELEGYETFTAVVAVGPGERANVAATMMKAAPIEARAGGAEGAEGGAFPVVPVAFMAGGGAVFAGGLIVGILANGKAGDSETGSDSAADSAKSMALVADIMMGVGIAAVGVGLVLVLMDDDSPESARGEAPSFAATPVLTPSYVGGSASLRF